MNDNKTEYDVALSFAGEDRAYVEMVAESLQRKDVNVFYDKFEDVDLWGKNLYDHLSDIYSKKARFTVIFISKFYRDKVWTNHERKAAQAKALKESEDSILPARFDATEIPGLLETVKYLDLRTHSPEEVAVKICKKLGVTLSSIKESSVPPLRGADERGEVSFNYSNHNGRFIIGKGVYEFETAWSKASGQSIHIYNDPPSISGVAITSLRVEEIVDASKLDMSSRSRTVDENQIAVVKNSNGFYAVLEIIDIQDDSRGDSEDKLSFRYVILTDGTADFSRVPAEVTSGKQVK